MTTRDDLLAEYHDVLETLAQYRLDGRAAPYDLLDRVRDLRALLMPRLNNMENA